MSYHSCSISVSLNNQKIKLLTLFEIQTLRNIDIYAPRIIKSLLGLTIKNLFCHFSRELLGCDLWFLGKVLPSRRVEYNPRKKNFFFDLLIHANLFREL